MTNVNGDVLKAKTTFAQLSPHQLPVGIAPKHQETALQYVYMSQQFEIQQSEEPTYLLFADVYAGLLAKKKFEQPTVSHFDVDLIKNEWCPSGAKYVRSCPIIMSFLQLNSGNNKPQDEESPRQLENHIDVIREVVPFWSVKELEDCIHQLLTHLQIRAQQTNIFGPEPQPQLNPQPQ